MAIKQVPTASIFLLLLISYSANGITNSRTSTHQGNQCTVSTTTLLNNLTDIMENILKSQLKIQVTYDNKNSVGGSTQPMNWAHVRPPQPQPPLPTLPSTSPSPPTLWDCGDIVVPPGPVNVSGVYKIKPHTHPVSPAKADSSQFSVYCDMDTDGGGWTVFQRRDSYAVGFFRDWEDYKHGFGFLNGDFWLGLERLHQMTAVANYELRVDLEDFSGNRAYARYDRFYVGDESTFYRLILGDYQGTAGDSLKYHDNMPFSTKDQDHDQHKVASCAQTYKGGWWYKGCQMSNLNGLHMRIAESSDIGMTWYHWKRSHVSLKSSQMKIRRIR